MDFMSGLADVMEPLNKIREEQGEEAWRKACYHIAKQLFQQGPKGAAFARVTFPDVDFEAMASEISAASKEPEPHTSTLTAEEAADMMVEAMRATMPRLRTQAQFDAFMMAFDALRMTANAIFEGDTIKATQGEEAIHTALGALRQATDMSAKLRDVPEAATSKAANAFKQPPAQFEERDAQKRLLSELERVLTLGDLEFWYERNRSDLDRVVSPALRNPLFDTIRAKKLSLGRP